MAWFRCFSVRFNISGLQPAAALALQILPIRIVDDIGSRRPLPLPRPIPLDQPFVYERIGQCLDLRHHQVPGQDEVLRLPGRGAVGRAGLVDAEPPEDALTLLVALPVGVVGQVVEAVHELQQHLLEPPRVLGPEELRLGEEHGHTARVVRVDEAGQRSAAVLHPSHVEDVLVDETADVLVFSLRAVAGQFRGNDREELSVSVRHERQSLGGKLDPS